MDTVRAWGVPRGPIAIAEDDLQLGWGQLGRGWVLVRGPSAQHAPNRHPLGHNLSFYFILFLALLSTCYSLVVCCHKRILRLFICCGSIFIVEWVLLCRPTAMDRFVRQAAATMPGSELLDHASFGPQFGDKFDFTIVFSNTILTALPAALMIAAGPIYMLSYRKATAVTSKRGLLWAKMVSLLCSIYRV